MTDPAKNVRLPRWAVDEIDHEANEAWKWAERKIRHESRAIAYEQGVRAGMKIAFKFVLDRVRATEKGDLASPDDSQSIVWSEGRASVRREILGDE